MSSPPSRLIPTTPWRGLTAARQAEVQAEIATAFRFVFLTMALYAACGSVLAMTQSVAPDHVTTMAEQNFDVRSRQRGRFQRP